MKIIINVTCCAVLAVAVLGLLGFVDLPIVPFLALMFVVYGIDRCRSKRWKEAALSFVVAFLALVVALAR